MAFAGANLALFDINEPEANTAAEEMRKTTGQKTRAITCDVTKQDDIKEAVAEVLEHFGHIDILINNAGKSFHGTALNISEEEWNRSVALNFTAAFLMCREVGRHMVAQRYGRIVNIASPASVMTLSHVTSYGPAKAGNVQLTRQLAAEWAQYGVTVNTVSPGWVKTTMNAKKLEEGDFRAQVEKRIPVGRIGMLEELVAPIVFLCSEGASFVIGQHLFVDGGETIFGY